MRALIVDDFYGDLLLTRIALTKSGIDDVDIAQTIEQAINAITHKAYDIIIIDKNFGGIDGAKFASKINGGVKIVVSGIDGDGVDTKKPLTPEKLKLVINRGAANEERRIGAVSHGIATRAESEQRGFSDHADEVRGVLDGSTSGGGHDRWVDYSAQSSVSGGRKNLYKSNGGRMMDILKAMPYQAICTAGVLLAFACGSLVVSGVQMAKENAYRSGQAEVIRFIPIHVLTEINV